MSAARRVRTPHSLRFLVAGAAILLGLGALIPPPAAAAPPRYPDILPLSQVKPGMKGYGLTTFKGTTISRFEVTVIGILKKENNGRDLILIRMDGGPITARGANLIQGMSGSPIYLKGKVAGAFSMGEQFPKEPVGMVTPIEDMLEAWDPDIPQQPTFFDQPGKNKPRAAKLNARWTPNHRSRVVELSEPVTVGGRALKRLVLNASLGDPRISGKDTAVLHRATMVMSATGLTERNRAWMQAELDKRGYAITLVRGAAAKRSADFKGVPLKPGSAFGTFLASGDLEFGGTGTITYRRGSRILGFGHPLMGLGAMEAAITSASIVDIFSSLRVSHHIAIVGPVIGTLSQDRDFSVSGEIGKMPRMIPVEMSVRDATSRRSKTFHTKIFQHPDITPLLARMLARQAVAQIRNTPGDTMARVTTTVEAAEVGKITRSNVVFDPNDISTGVTQDLSDITNLTSGNPFYPLPIKGVRISIEMMDGHDTAAVERIFLKQGRYEPGDTVEIGVVLKPYRREPVTRTLTLKIPSDTPTGRYQLMVRGGMVNTMRFGGFVLGGAGDTQTPPANVRQMVTRLHEREINTDLVARLVLNTGAVAIEGEKLSQLPPNLAALMRSERNSGVRLERDELKTVQPTEYVVSGTQQLMVTVVRKNTQEPTNPGAPGGLSSPGASGNPTILIPGGSPTTLNDTSLDDAAALPVPSDQDGADNPAGTSKGTSRPALTLHPEVIRWMAALSPQSPKPDEKKPAAPASGPVAGPTSPPPAVQVTPANPVAPDPGGDRPVGRQMQIWRQTARNDFAPGKFQGTSVTASGELRLASTLRRLTSTPETYIWTLLSDEQGNLYAGTGTEGRVLKIDTAGKVRPLADLPVVAVHSLLLARDGNLYAGCGGKGSLYRVTPDGSVTLVCTLKEKYILALAQDSKGNLFLAPGGSGTVYKVEVGKPTASAIPYVKTTADHIMSLTIDKDDTLYLGTANEGAIYKVTADGKSSVLYDAKENTVTALAVDPQGHLYAATGPKGIVYRINPDGTANVLFDRAPNFYTALKTSPEGIVYAATVSAVYQITPNAPGEPIPATVKPLDNPRDVDFLSLAPLPSGGVAIGTGNVGEVFVSTANSNGGSVTRGTFESVIHDARQWSRWGSARWNATLTGGASLRVETRTGNVSEPDATWSDWSPVQTAAKGAMEGTITSPPARFLQYRLTLEGNGAGQEVGLRDIAIGYMARNQAPRITFQLPGGGERWARSQTIRWNASDPDGDTLDYQLSYSTDGGATWKPLPGAARPGEAPPAANSGPSSRPEPPSLEELQKQLDAQPNMPQQLKQVILEGARRRIGAQNALAGGTGSRETSKALDTKLLPDGLYWLRVVASDHISNPTDAQTTQAVSEPFFVCNSMPKITVSMHQVVQADKSVAVEGSVSQNLIPVTAVQYRVDGGDWIAAVSRDGLFDTTREGFAFATLPLTRGKHTLEISAFNAAGTRSVERITVEVP